MKHVVLAVVLFATLLSCEGLVPPEPVGFTGVSGTISIVGGVDGWPIDSLPDLRVVLFEQQPNSPDSILPFILSGRASFSSSLPQRFASAPYTVEVQGAPRTYRYVVVAMQVGPNVLLDWKMAALHTDDGTSPLSITIVRGQNLPIDFTVDFSNLPPQPF